MTEEERCKHGIVREWCGECNTVEEEMSEAKGKHRHIKRGERKRLKELEKQANEQADRILAGHHPDWFSRQLKRGGKWYAQGEAVAKEQPRTREERRHALLESLQGSIERKVKKFAGTDTKRWGWGLGYEPGDRLSEFWIIANDAVCEYLDQEESGTLPEGLQGVEPEEAVAMKFEYKSHSWYDSKKKLDRIVFGGRGLGGEEKHLRQRALEGDPVALKGVRWLQREIRKMDREGKRWLLARASGWRLPLVPKNILQRAQFENTIIDGAAWQGYITREQAELLTKWATYRTNEELAEELGKSKSTLYRDLKEAKKAIMPYAEAATRFGWYRFLKKGIEFDPRKWKPESTIDIDIEPGGATGETDEELDSLWFGDVHDDFDGANED